MKKMYVALVALIITTAGFSQASIGVQVIGNASNLSFKSEQVPDSKKSFQPAFGAGIVADLPLGGNLSLRPSLNYLQKKSSIEFSDDDENVTKLKTSLNYLELPVDFVYTVPGKSVSLYFGAGPSIGYGISGKMKYSGLVEGEDGEPVQAEESVDAFKKEDKGGAGLGNLDISANVIAGLKFNSGLFVHAGYLGSIRNLAAEGGTYKNYGLQLTLGYMFSKN